MREWMRRRRNVIVILAALLALGVAGLAVASRWGDRATLAWRQGPVVAAPTIITEVEAIRLTLEDQPGLLAYSLQCLQAVGDLSIVVTAHLPHGTATATFPRACSAVGQPAGRGTMLRLDELRAGESVTMALSVTIPHGPAQSVMVGQSQTYIMGADGRLRLTRGSARR